MKKRKLIHNLKKRFTYLLWSTSCLESLVPGHHTLTGKLSKVLTLVTIFRVSQFQLGRNWGGRVLGRARLSGARLRSERTVQLGRRSARDWSLLGCFALYCFASDLRSFTAMPPFATLRHLTHPLTSKLASPLRLFTPPAL